MGRYCRDVPGKMKISEEERCTRKKDLSEEDRGVPGKKEIPEEARCVPERKEISEEDG